MWDRLIRENREKLQKLNLPKIKPKSKIIVLDTASATSIKDFIEFKYVHEPSKYTSHATYVGQIIKLVAGQDIELYSAAVNWDNVIDFAIENNIKVINASMVTVGSEQAEETLKRYYEWGGIFVAASGNNPSRPVRFPANSSYTLAVSATNDPCCVGKEVDVTADSWWYVNNFGMGLHGFNGTSASAPVISACVLIVLEKFPHWNLDQVKKFMYENSVPLENRPYERFFSFPDNFGEGEEVLFKDIANHWAMQKIVKWAKRGILKGYPDGEFKPDKLVTRAELIQVLDNLEQQGYLVKGE